MKHAVITYVFKTRFHTIVKAEIGINVSEYISYYTIINGRSTNHPHLTGLSYHIAMEVSNHVRRAGLADVDENELDALLYAGLLQEIEKGMSSVKQNSIDWVLD